MRARRSNKRFPLSSKEIEIDLVTAVAARTGENRFTIDLSNADVTLGCESATNLPYCIWKVSLHREDCRSDAIRES